jgi:hypothetical protein
MDEGLRLAAEMHENIWKGLKNDLADLSADEIGWRPLPQANNIDRIIRHLRIEAEWHANSLEHGAAMPHENTPELQRSIDAVPFDFARNLAELEELFARFTALLREITLGDLERQTGRAYAYVAAAGRPLPTHFLGYHQVMHLAMHWGQIRTIRNLYKKTRGEPARFHPENPTYPA